MENKSVESLKVNINFNQNLLEAIKAKDISLVKQMLAALQFCYNNYPKFTNSISLRKENRINANAAFFYQALESSLDIFKEIIRFCDNNSQHPDYVSFAKEDLIHLFYKCIFEKNIPALQFLVEEIEVNLLSRSVGFKTICKSPLLAATKDFETFKYLLPLCINAHQAANKDEIKEMIVPTIDEIKKSIASKKKATNKQKKVVSPEIKMWQSELNLLYCYQDIYTLFNQKKIQAIYSNLGSSFQKNQEFTLTLIGYFLLTLINELIDSPNLISEKSIIFLNTLVQAIYNLIKEDESIQKPKLQTIFMDSIIPHYLAFLTEYLTKIGNDKEYNAAKSFLIFREIVPTLESMPAQIRELKHLNNVKLLEENLNEHSQELRDAEIDHGVLLQISLIMEQKKRFNKAINFLTLSIEKSGLLGLDDIEDLERLANYTPITKLHSFLILGSFYMGILPGAKIHQSTDKALAYWITAMQYVNLNRNLTTGVNYNGLLTNLYNILYDEDMDFKSRHSVFRCLLVHFITLNKLQEMSQLLHNINRSFNKELFERVIKKFIYEHKYFINDNEKSAFIFLLHKLEFLLKQNAESFFKYPEDCFLAIGRALLHGEHFSTNPIRAVRIFLKSLKYGNEQALVDLKELMEKNLPDFEGLPYYLAKRLLETPDDEFYTFLCKAIYILGIGAEQGCQECFNKLQEIYQRIRFSNDAKLLEVKKVLSVEFDNLLSKPYYQEDANALLIKLSILSVNRQSKESSYSTSIQNLHTLKYSLLNWLEKATRQHNAYVNENHKVTTTTNPRKSLFPPFLTMFKPTAIPDFVSMAGKLHNVIKFITQLLNGITKIIQEEHCDDICLSLADNSFQVISLGNISDVYSAITIFIDNYQQEIQIKEIDDLCKLLKQAAKGIDRETTNELSTTGM